MPKRSFTREGITAALYLVDNTKNESLWLEVETKYDEMIEKKKGKDLVKLDQFCTTLQKTFHKNKKDSSITKEQLLKIVQWKFQKGKPRYALMKFLNANSEKTIQECSTKAFQNNDIKELCKLKGVGPATASAILSLYAPDKYAFMDDEIIECLYDGKRGYTLKIYNEVNDKCVELANELNKKESKKKKQDVDWTPRRVGKTLWTGARLSAHGLDWFMKDDEDVDDDDDDDDSSKEEKTTRKKRKTRK